VFGNFKADENQHYDTE